MGLVIEIKDIEFENNFEIWYSTGRTPGSVSSYSSETWGTQYSGATTEGVFSGGIETVSIDIEDEVENPFNTQFWFKLRDIVTGNFIIENIYIHDFSFYEGCIPVTPTPTPTQTVTSTPTQTITLTLTNSIGATPPPTPTVSVTATQTVTPTTSNTSTSCILISQTFLLVDNLGCGILDRYIEYTLTYVENGTPTPAPEDITFSVTTQNINNPLDETTYPILLPSGQTTVTDNSVLIRVWDNCEDRISTNYSIESTGLTPSYALCTLTPTPTPTSGSTVYLFYYAQEVDCSNASTTYCSTTSPNGYLIGAPVYSLTQYANITPGTTLLYTDANLTTLLTGSAIDFNSNSIIAISETLLANTNSGQHKYVKIDSSGEIKTVGVFNCAGSGGDICGGDL